MVISDAKMRGTVSWDEKLLMRHQSILSLWRMGYQKTLPASTKLINIR
jgi:hypothetical protein